MKTVTHNLTKNPAESTDVNIIETNEYTYFEAICRPDSERSDELDLKSIIGPDDRKQIMDNSGYPLRTLTRIESNFIGANPVRGSGVMLGPRHVLTAGHVVYSHNFGGWARSSSVWPGRNKLETPFGTANAVRYLTTEGYVNNRNQELDFGMIILDRNVGRNSGTMGFSVMWDHDLQGAEVVVAGYPNDKQTFDGDPEHSLWGTVDQIHRVEKNQIFYQNDTVGGHSGSPVWSYWKNRKGPIVCGIHNYGNDANNENIASRLNKPAFDLILSWIRNN